MVCILKYIHKVPDTDTLDGYNFFHMCIISNLYRLVSIDRGSHIVVQH